MIRNRIDYADISFPCGEVWQFSRVHGRCHPTEDNDYNLMRSSLINHSVCVCDLYVTLVDLNLLNHIIENTLPVSSHLRLNPTGKISQPSSREHIICVKSPFNLTAKLLRVIVSFPQNILHVSNHHCLLHVSTCIKSLYQFSIRFWLHPETPKQQFFPGKICNQKNKRFEAAVWFPIEAAPAPIQDQSPRQRVTLKVAHRS